MQFVYFPEPSTQITLRGEEHKYLFKVRRLKKSDPVKIRTLKDDFLYIYRIDEINKKEAVLSLCEKIISPNRPHTFVHLAWCIVDPKNIEKTLPFLNETGVGKITFVYCDYSQKNFRLKPERIEKILINSCQQCGRSSLMQTEFLNSSSEFFSRYSDFYALDFDGEDIGCGLKPDKPFLIGPEGGFSEEERACFKEKLKFRGFILRSETAAVGISAKTLL